MFAESELRPINEVMREWLSNNPQVKLTVQDRYSSKWLVRAGYSLRLLCQRQQMRLPSLLTQVAVFLAGRKRSTADLEWRGHLAGWPGCGLSRRKQTWAACGFVWAALRYRLEDAADLAWRPVDAVLGSRLLSNLLIWSSVLVMVVAIVRHDGRYGLVADIQDPVALGGALYAAIRIGRWWRQIKLPEPKPRRARELVTFCRWCQGLSDINT